ncbi:RHS repeat domain-containing protein [Brevundimonas sp.]|uniref:RHS repeat domain-containing protein n=1 Tax=Brevundimonas sp. TaxID=1871086 RepID=UPI003F71167E
MRLNTVLGAAIGAGLSFMPMTAAAQVQPIPPETYTLDPRGVDLVAGTFVHSTTEVVIGQPEAGGIAYGRTFTGTGWRDNLIGGISVAGSDMTISVGPISEQFIYNGSAWKSKFNNGSTVAFGVGYFIVTDARGNMARFDHLGANPYSADTALVTWMTSPDGSRTDYAYNSGERCLEPSPGGQCGLMGLEFRLASVRTNRGYMVKYAYASNDPQSPAWTRPINVTGINLAVDWCDPTSDACSNFSQNWPSVTYGGFSGGNPSTVEDQAGRVTTYGYSSAGDANLISTISLPGAATPDITIVYNTDQLVSTVTDASGTWTYGYSISGTTLTTTTQGPLSQGNVVTVDLTIGRATTIRDALTNQTSYQYDADRRITRITRPEGDYTNFTYDARSNLTSSVSIPKPGAMLQALTSTATFPSDCAEPVPVPATICNRPISTTAPNGGTTDYSWDAETGQLLSVTAPRPSPGAARPQTRYAYVGLEAYFHNGPTTFASGGEISLQVESSACAVGEETQTPACGGSQNELVETVGYVTSLTPHNLLPVSLKQGSRQTPEMAEVQRTWTAVGRPETVNGPLPGAADTTIYLYAPQDPSQMIGIIGPDPDGMGAGLNRASRYTYDGRGLLTAVETGTAASGEWANFTPLLRTETTYDPAAFHRPVQTREVTPTGAIATVQQVSYDAAGRRSCIATRMNPDTFGTLPLSACTAEDAGAFGSDRIVKLSYDAVGRVVGSTSGYTTADSQSELLTYSANGQTTSLTDGKGNTSIMEYDGFDRLSRLRFPNATCCGTSATDFEEYTFDAWGRPYSMRNRAGAVTYFGYDGLNRLTFVNAPVGTPDVTTLYDNLGRTTYRTDGVNSVTRALDPLSRLVSEASPQTGAMSYQYDAGGRMVRMTWPDAFYAEYQHNLYAEVTSIRVNGATSGAGVIATYSWSDLGRPLSVQRADGAGVGTAYSYDAWARLSSLSHNAAGSSNDLALQFAYNPAGQIVTRTVSNGAYVSTPNASVNYGINGRNQVTSVAGQAVTYDLNGNTTELPGATYTYDALNRLASTTAAGGTLMNTYDPFGRMALVDNGSVKSRLQYSGPQLVAEYNELGQISARHIPGLGLNDIVTSYTGSGTGTPTWLLPDERGSNIGSSSADGLVTSINRFNEYGIPASGNTGRFQFTGQAFFNGAASQDFRARAYLSQLGRFTQADPTGYAAGTNLYAYGSLDPINRIDPFGLEDIEVGCLREILWTVKAGSFLDLKWIQEVPARCLISVPGLWADFQPRYDQLFETVGQAACEAAASRLGDKAVYSTLSAGAAPGWGLSDAVTMIARVNETGGITVTLNEYVAEYHGFYMSAGGSVGLIYNDQGGLGGATFSDIRDFIHGRASFSPSLGAEFTNNSFGGNISTGVPVSIYKINSEASRELSRVKLC